MRSELLSAFHEYAKAAHRCGSMYDPNIDPRVSLDCSMAQAKILKLIGQLPEGDNVDLGKRP